MADILWSDVTTMFPNDAGLAAVPVGAQTLILRFVNTSLSARFFGGEDSAKYELARIYLAAHEATANGLTGGAAAATAVISESEGGVSRSYATPSASAATGEHSSTEYGRRFDVMVRSSPYRIGVTS